MSRRAISPSSAAELHPLTPVEGDGATIAGYRVLGELGHGHDSVVLRVEKHGVAYALKRLQRGSNATHDIDVPTRFRREASFLARLSHRGLLSVIEVGEHAGEPYLVMELVEGETLEQRLRRGPLGRDEAIALARELADVLVEVHRHGMVHRDLKPANVMLTEAGTVKLVDFGYAGHVAGPGEVDDAVMGTFLYAAPEQTRIVKRPVDGRTDLYALGATLFQCLVGRPPFEGETVSELLRMHAQVVPPRVDALRDDVGPVLAAVVARLLAKDPDDRYPSAAALLADLRAIAELEATHAARGTVDLAAREVGRVADELPFIGRTAALAELRRALGRAAASTTQFVQIEGPVGSGKSRLVGELVADATARGYLVLSSPCQAADSLPLAGLRDALDSHVAAILRAPADEQARMIARVRDAAGELAPILKRLSRNLARVLEASGEVATLDPASERERFYRTVARFLRRLGEAHGALVWAIDDIQWIDGPTAELLAELAGDRSEPGSMLVITTWRSDRDGGEVGAQLRASAHADALERVELAPLGADEHAALVHAYLGRRDVDARVTERLAALSGGNPLATLEYLESMLSAGILSPGAEGWQIDWTAFAAMSMSTDVERLLLDRIAGLPAAIREILDVAAIVGGRFTRGMLAEISGRPEDEVVAAIERGVAAKLLEPDADGRHRFVHERIQATLEHAMAPEVRRDRHHRVAEVLDAERSDAPEWIHALARHYGSGHPERAPRRVFEVMLAAGKQALGDFANATAAQLLGQAGALAEAAAITRAEEIELAEAVGLALARIGRMEEGYAQLRAGLGLARSDLERARFHHLLALGLASEGKNEDAWQHVVAGYRAAGQRASSSVFVQVITTLYYLVVGTLRVKTGLGYGSARGESAERRRILSRLNDVASIVTYMSGRPYALLGVIFRQLHNAHFLGTSSENAKAHAWFGFALALLAMARASRRHCDVALTMAEQVGDRGLVAYVRYLEAIQTSVGGDLVRGEQLSKAAIVEGRKWLGSYEYSQITTELAYEYLYRGLSHEAIALAQAELPAIDRMHSILFQANMRGLLYSQLALVGRVDEAVRVREQWLAHAAALPGVPFCQTYVHANEIQVLLDQEDFGAELEAHIERFLGWAADEYHNRYAWGLIAYVRREQLRRAPVERRAAARKAYVSAIRAFAIMRASTPIHQCHVAVLQASLAREDGALARADALLRKAETLAAKVDSRWAAFEIARERAHLARRGGRADTAVQAARALEIAQAQGWRNRARLIEREFSIAGARPSRSMVLSTRTRAVNHSERFADALLRVGLASGSTLDPQAQAQAVLDEIVALFAAERAFLFRCDEHGALELRAGRDGGRRDVQELGGYSHTVVERVRAEQKPLVLTGTEAGQAIGAESVVAYNLRSIMAAPVIVRERLLGVVYVDSRVAKGLFAEEDLDFFVALANHIGVVLELAQSARLEVRRAALEKELQLTATVQSMFLPKNARSRGPASDIYGVYLPAAMSGGDWWWHDAPGPDRLRVVIGDLTGHGAAPAMLTAAVATCFRGVDAGPEGLRRTIAEVHALLHDTTGSAYAMTLCAIDIDTAARTARCVFAGSPPIFRVRAGARPELVPSGGAPLGVSGLVLEERVLELVDGERLVLFTDGVNELPTTGGRRLGLRRLQALVAETSTLELVAAGDAMASALHSYSANADHERGHAEADDDMTFVLVDVGPRA